MSVEYFTYQLIVVLGGYMGGSLLVEKVMTTKGMLQLKLIHLNYTLTLELTSSSLLPMLMLRKVDVSVVQKGILSKQTLVLEKHHQLSDLHCMFKPQHLIGGWVEIGSRRLRGFYQ